MPGEENAEILENIGGTWQVASVRGDLLPDGCEATEGYPVLTLNENGKKVNGFVFSSKDLHKHWSDIDEFEGQGYRRVKTPVELEGGKALEVNIYVLAD